MGGEDILADDVQRPQPLAREPLFICSYQAFLKHLLSHFAGPIILIQDGASFHTSQAMRKFMEEHQSQLIVYQLPSYSSDYNPIEYLWKR